MFTDGPATPTRLEVLLELLSEFDRGLSRERIYKLLQPDALSNGIYDIAKANISAAIQLNIVKESGSVVSLVKRGGKKGAAKDQILATVDELVLSNTNIEFHIALFYSYYLGLDHSVYDRADFSREDWAIHFNKEAMNGNPGTNPFNKEKHTGLDRWFGYIGLGWYDSNEFFHAVPYHRVDRSLPQVFEKNTKMKGDDFMVRLSELCPELDGGAIFLQANKYRNYRAEDKQCTLGLSQALVELHEDHVIRLHCPKDSRGWWIGSAEPSRDDYISSDRITLIEYLR